MAKRTSIFGRRKKENTNVASDTSGQEQKPSVKGEQDDIELEIESLLADIQTYYLAHPDVDPTLPDKIWVKDVDELEEKITEHIPKKVVEDEMVVKNLIEIDGDTRNPLDFSVVRRFEDMEEYRTKVFEAEEIKYVDDAATKEVQKEKVSVRNKNRQHRKKAKEKEVEVFENSESGLFQNGEVIGTDRQINAALVSEESEEDATEGIDFQDLQEMLQQESSERMSSTENRVSGAFTNTLFSGVSGGATPTEKSDNEHKSDTNGTPDTQEALQELLEQGKMKEETFSDALRSQAAEITDGDEWNKDMGEAEDTRSVEGEQVAEDIWMTPEELKSLDSFESQSSNSPQEEEDEDFVNKVFVSINHELDNSSGESQISKQESLGMSRQEDLEELISKGETEMEVHEDSENSGMSIPLLGIEAEEAEKEGQPITEPMMVMDDSEPSGSSTEPSDDSEPSGSSTEPSDDSEPSGSSTEPSDDSEPSGSSNEPSDDSEPSGSSNEPSDDSEPSGSSGEPSDDSEPSGSSNEPSNDSEPSGSSTEPSDDSESSGSSNEPSDDSEPSGSSGERFMQTENPGESLNDLFNNLQTKVQDPERVDELLEIVTASEEAVQDVEKEEDKVDEVDVAEPQEEIDEEMSEDTLEDITEENSDEISEELELHTDAPQFESLESQEEERLMDLLKSLQDESPTERPMQVQVEVPLEVPVEVPIAKEIPVKIPVEVPIPKEIPVQKDVLAVREVSVEKIIPIEKEVLVMNHESRDTATAEISEDNATPSQKSNVGDKIDGTNGTQETKSNKDAKASGQNQKEHEKEVVEINPTGEKTEDKLELVTYEKRRKGLFSRMLDRIKNAFKKKPKQIPEAKETAQEHKQEIKMMEPESVTSHLEHKELQITGVINGSIQGENIIINTGALVKKSVEAKGVVLCMKDSTVMGDLKGEEIIVEGMVRGNVYASQKVQITDNALIIGNIYAPEIAVDKEAIIQGSIFDFEKKEMIDEGDERKCENVSVSM